MGDYSELKRLAESATNCYGPMRVETDHNSVHQVIGAGSWKILSAWHTPDGKGRFNAEFHAAASPLVVLSLIATIDVLRNDTESRCEWANEASAEIDRLQNIEAENDELRKDAERYRWLRSRESAEDPEISVTQWTQIEPNRAAGSSPRLEVLDAAIDAAMSKEASHD